MPARKKKKSNKKTLQDVLTVLTLACAASMLRSFVNHVDIPAHLTGHPVIALPDMLTEEQVDRLLDLSKEFKIFPTNRDDTLFYKATREHIGEAVPIGPNGTCSHVFMVPDRAKENCVLPGRIDIARHFFTAGGITGMKEFPSDLTSRVLSFGRYMFNASQYPIAAELFKEQKFSTAARRICPASKQYLDPIQFNLIMQVPGQTVPLHLDGPYFWGASRFQFPQWLLAAMVFSNLFQDRFIDQVQVVAYYHKWNDTSSEGGSFKHWATGGQQPDVLPAISGSGNAVDGSKVVHAGDVYRYSTATLPTLKRTSKIEMEYMGDEHWKLTEDGETKKSYNTSDLRFTIVYRARCFADKDEAVRYHADTNYMELEEILSVFRKDLIERGKLNPNKEISPMAFNLLILDTYIKYPYPPNAWIPFNYCAISTLIPALEPILKLFC